jgi:PBSX family phage terminase large subunit
MREYEVDIIQDETYLPAYLPLLDENDIDIEILYGGRDSGKSYFVAQLLTEEALKLPYFRCLLIKQTQESIKESQVEMMQGIWSDWGVDELFSLRLSPLGIKCIGGATFAARGMDKPGKLKSFANPSHAWVEEANQISEAAFITLLTTLRSNDCKVKIFLTLNPEADTADFTKFWLYKWFFASNPKDLSFKATKEVTIDLPATKIRPAMKKTVAIKYRVTHVTYADNPHVTDQRIAFHENLKTTSSYFYRVYTLGLWGNKENTDPWAFNYRREIHARRGVTVTCTRDQILYLSFDFNRNPACVTVIQWYNGWIRVMQTIKLTKSGTDALCDYISTWYPNYLYMVTGDYSGNTASSIYAEEVTNYTTIKKKLKLTDGQLKLVPNPKLEKNQTLVNNILKYYPVMVDIDNASNLIFDFEHVRRRADGTIVKDDRNDPAQQADALDTFRYFCNTFMPNFQPPEE